MPVGFEPTKSDHEPDELPITRQHTRKNRIRTHDAESA